MLVFVVFYNSMCVNAAMASSPHEIVEVQLETSSTDDDNESSRKHQRMPSLPIICYINESGVSFEKKGLEIMDCLIFEIKDPITEECLFYTSSESIFIDNLFSLRGEVTIIFRFENFTLKGMSI